MLKEYRDRILPSEVDRESRQGLLEQALHPSEPVFSLGHGLEDLRATTNIASKPKLLVKPGEGTARPGSKQEEEKDVAILRAGQEEEGRSGND